MVPSECAIAWVLHQKGVTAALAGSANPQHVRANAAAAELALPKSLPAQLEVLIPLGPRSRAKTGAPAWAATALLVTYQEVQLRCPIRFMRAREIRTPRLMRLLQTAIARRPRSQD
jgi:hypothetical protein